MERRPFLNIIIVCNMYSIKLLLVLAVILQNIGQQVMSADFHSPLIKYLPGFQGTLPFQLTTGYVGVDKSEDVQLFYYFVKSQTNPRDDPLILWITGGPGCSSFTAFAYEFGPLYIEQVEYNGTLPTLILNPHTWTKEASIIFLDLPVGTGFSYGKTSIASHSSDPQACAHALQFLKKWFINHPQFFTNPFYVGGDSYAGIFVPVITQMISNENKAEAGHEQSINLKLRHGLFYEQVLENICDEYPPELRRSLSDEKGALMHGSAEKTNTKSSSSVLECRFAGYRLCRYWFNNGNVRKALHVRKGTTGEWERCRDSLAYDYDISDSRPYHANLNRKGYKSLIYRACREHKTLKVYMLICSGSGRECLTRYFSREFDDMGPCPYFKHSGDHDMLVPFQSTQAWIRYLNYSIIDEWRPWIVQGQYAGYTRAYSNKMTFATVKGAGHTAPEYKPVECYAMFERWISDRPL